MRMGSVNIILAERINTTSMNEATVGKGSAERYGSSALGDSFAIAEAFALSSLLGRLSQSPKTITISAAVPMAAL